MQATADFLRNVAVTQRLRGWTQEVYHDLANGRCCLMGAVGATSGSDSLWQAAQRALIRVIDSRQCGHMCVENWNDVVAKSIDEVLDLIEEAAKAEEAEP